MQLGFDFRDAIANTVTPEIQLAPEADSGFLARELDQLNIEPVLVRAKA